MSLNNTRNSRGENPSGTPTITNFFAVSPNKNNTNPPSKKNKKIVSSSDEEEEEIGARNTTTTTTTPKQKSDVLEISSSDGSPESQEKDLCAENPVQRDEPSSGGISVFSEGDKSDESSDDDEDRLEMAEESLKLETLRKRMKRQDSASSVSSKQDPVQVAPVMPEKVFSPKPVAITQPVAPSGLPNYVWRGGIIIHVYSAPEVIMGTTEREWYECVSVTPLDKIELLLKLHPRPSTNKEYVSPLSIPYKQCLHMIVHEFMSSKHEAVHGKILEPIKQSFSQGINSYLKENKRNEQKASLVIFLALVDVQEFAQEAFEAGNLPDGQRPAYMLDSYNNVTEKNMARVMKIYNFFRVQYSDIWLRLQFATLELVKEALAEQYRKDTIEFKFGS